MRALNPVLCVAAAIAFAAQATLAQNGEADAYCDVVYRAPSSMLFRVDTNLATDLDWEPGGIDLTDTELVNLVDQVVQNQFRQGRARVRARVFQDASTECWDGDWEDSPCIRANRNNEDLFCAMNPGSMAHASCAPLYGCNLVFCIDNFAFSDLPHSRFHAVAGHELGHIFGLAHPNDTPLCITSDGCEGELMCTPTSEQHSLRFGDARNYRNNYNGCDEGGFQNRKVFTGARSLGGSSLTFSQLSGVNAAFAPRIDCAELSAAAYQCVAVLEYSQGGCAGTQRVKIVGLNGYSNSAFGSVTTILDRVNNEQFVADIAISPDGDEAFVTTVAQTGANGVFVWHVDLLTGAIVYRSLDYSAQHPVRVTWNDDVGGAITLGAMTDSPSSSWRMHKVWFNAGTNSIGRTALEFDPFDDNPAQADTIGIAADFDLDCANAMLSDDECVLVATLSDGRAGAASEPPGSLFSVHFHVDPVLTTVEIVGAPDWTNGGQYNAQAVLGVAVTSRLIVSAGRRSDTSSVQNSRIAEFDNYDVTVGDRLLNYIHKSDAETCSSTTVWNITMGGATPHGGESLAWCPSCSGGRSISLHLGKREDGDAFCF